MTRPPPSPRGRLPAAATAAVAWRRHLRCLTKGGGLPPAGGEKKKKKKKKTPPQGEGVSAPPVPAASSAGPDEGEPGESVVPSDRPDEGEPEEPAGASIEPDEREAADVPPLPLCTCPACGYGINGGGVLCLAPGCGGVAKGALQCRTCELPVAPDATCDGVLCPGGGGFAPPRTGAPCGCGATGAAQEGPSRRPPSLYDWVAPMGH